MRFLNDDSLLSSEYLPASDGSDGEAPVTSAFISPRGIQVGATGRSAFRPYRSRFWSGSEAELAPAVAALFPEGVSYQVVTVPGDGNCFFSAVAAALLDVSQPHYSAEQLRSMAVNYMVAHYDYYFSFFDEQQDMGAYVMEMSQSGTWVDGRIIHALMNALCLRLEIADISGQLVDRPILHTLECDHGDPALITVRLQRSGLVGMEHYDAITLQPTQSNVLMALR